LDLVDPMRFGAVLHQEQVLMNKRPRTVRKVYMADHAYKVGWVVDWDVNQCMVCSAQFGWLLMRPKHHCRACGALVCHACSPYVTSVPGLNEFGGSRVCINCFGLKPVTFTLPAGPPGSANSPSITTKASEVYKGSPVPSPGNSFSHRHSESAVGSIQDTTPNGSVRRTRSAKGRQSGGAGGAAPVLGMTKEQIDKSIDEFEQEQQPLYEQDYLYACRLLPVPYI
jgi:hypothetical protein